MVNSLAKALTQVVSTLPQMLIVKTVDITPYCLESGPIIITSDGDYPSQCLKMSGNTKQVSNIMSQMSMDVTNFPEGGNLEYTITCPQPYSCGPCDSVAQGMNLPSKIPIIGSFFGGIELGNAAVCNDSNCPEPL